MRLPEQLDRLENALLLKQGELNDHEWALNEMDISCPDCKYEPDWWYLHWRKPTPYTCPKCSCPYHLPAVHREIERLENGSEPSAEGLKGAGMLPAEDRPIDLSESKLKFAGVEVPTPVYTEPIQETSPMKFAIACATVLFSTVGTATVIGLACCGYKFIELYFAVRP